MNDENDNSEESFEETPPQIPEKQEEPGTFINESGEEELNNTAKKLLLTRWNDTEQYPPGKKECCDICFPGQNVDARHGRAKIIWKYLASLNLSAKSASRYLPKTDQFELTKEQKTFINNNCGKMSALEISKTLFNNEKLSNLSLECRVVNKFIMSLNPAVRSAMAVEDVPQGNFLPPKTPQQAINKINRATQGMLQNKELLANQKTKLAIDTYIRFCHVGRFSVLMNNFQTQTDRDLFEETFTRYVWDKPDLSQEEIDAYLNLCLDIINHTKMQREVEKLTRDRDQCLDDSEGKKMSMAMVEMISSLYKEMDDNQKRQDKLREILIGKRKERLEAQIQANASVIQLVEAWRDEKQRQRMIKFAEERKKLCRDEIERLDTMETFIGEIFGINKESFE